MLFLFYGFYGFCRLYSVWNLQMTKPRDARLARYTGGARECVLKEVRALFKHALLPLLFLFVVFFLKCVFFLFFFSALSAFFFLIFFSLGIYCIYARDIHMRRHV